MRLTDASSTRDFTTVKQGHNTTTLQPLEPAICCLWNLLSSSRFSSAPKKLKAARMACLSGVDKTLDSHYSTQVWETHPRSIVHLSMVEKQDPRAALNKLAANTSRLEKFARRLRPECDAPEVVQHVLHNMACLPSAYLAKIQDLEAYARRGIRNRIIDLFKMESRAPEILSDSDPDVVDQMHQKLSDNEERPNTPSALLEQEQLRSMLLRALEQLEPDELRVTRALRLEGRSLRQVSLQLNISIDVVRRLAEQSLPKLRRLIEDSPPHDGSSRESSHDK